MIPPGIATSSPSKSPTAPPVSERRTTLHRILLACGIAAPLLYVAMLVLVPMRWEGYDSAAQTISELSAIGAPTRSLWVPLGIVYTLLVAAFGYGVWRAAGRNRLARVVGGVLIVNGIIGLLWPPMHLREVLAGGGKTLTDTLHVVWMAGTGLLMLLAMGFGAAAFGKAFRVYSIVSMVALLACGAMTSADVSRMEANLATPGMGVWERIDAAVFMLWMVVFAIVMLHRRPKVAADRGQGAVELPDGTRAVVASR